METLLPTGVLNSSDLLARFRHSHAVAVALIRQDGWLLDCNDCFSLLLGATGRDTAPHDVSALFAAPRFETLCGTLVETGQTIFEGILNIGDAGIACHSLIGSVRRDGPNLLLFAEHDVAEMARLNAQVLEINEELAEAQRELARRQRRLLQAQQELEAERDILEARVRERTLALSIAKEAAETANRAKTTFLANMSHELRTPMNAIMGMTDVVLRRSTDSRQQDQLKTVAQASRHLLGVLNDILDLSKIEAEKLVLEISDFTLDTVLASLLALVGTEAAAKGLDLRVDIGPEVGRMPLQGDSMRLRQILLNLLSNAIKFTSRGKVTLVVQLAETRAKDVLLRFEVRDTGIGIAAGDMPRLFKAFGQVDSSMSRRYGGTGLGLAISKRLSQMMGGDLGVRSEPGVGSVFWLTARFKLAENPVVVLQLYPTSAAEAALKTAFAGAHILLVEDEPINQEVMQELLEGAGLKVDVARNGLLACAMAEHTPYALILMDIQMPGMSGIEACQRIRGLAGWEKMPIVALTGNAFEEDRQACLEAGMNDHVGKPVEPDVLFETLLNWLTWAKTNPEATV